ncbi:hypothetical protein [Desulfitobacterium sp. PCE1]|uniref:mediterrocin family bacteriocin n=1 Tax=Desulfitobacterium sp. PCE1 TaxID=146907 RepID=UPI000A0270D8|nr:hypothetical protein [Desulfitobacterium sp. PCE1]
MKIRFSKKRTALLTLVMCSFLVFPAASYAETTLVHASKSGSGYFISNWMESKQASYSGSTEKLDYGFNTFLINEDIAYAYSNGSRHAAKIVNGNGEHYGPWKWANDWSDLEVRHAGNTVNYYSVDWD